MTPRLAVSTLTQSPTRSVRTHEDPLHCVTRIALTRCATRGVGYDAAQRISDLPEVGALKNRAYISNRASKPFNPS